MKKFAEIWLFRSSSQVMAVCRYAHASPPCLEDSPTNRWHAAYLEAGGKPSDLTAHIDYRADYDGLAVAWGINNKKGVHSVIVST